MVDERDDKKSESLEVRLSHRVKQDLMRKARAEGRSASDVVRQSIGEYLAGEPKETSPMFVALWKSAAAIAAAASVVLLAALPSSPVHAGPNLKSIFAMIDRNHDGRLSADEFGSHLSNPKLRDYHGAGASHFHAAMAALHHGAASGSHPIPTKADLVAHFKAMDSNHDGYANFDEFRAFHDRMMAHGHD